MNPLLHQGRPEATTETDIWGWYLLIKKELDQDYLSETEKSFLFDYYREAGLLRLWRRPFFRHHYAGTFYKAVRHIFDQRAPFHLLDLGCGTGTQSLYFSYMGVHVTAVDIDKTALDIFKKRKKFFENYLGKQLSIDIRRSDIFELDFDSIPPLDSIYSMFAFNMMQPSKQLLDILAERARTGCRLAILDGNNRSWLARLIPTRKREHCLSPAELCRELKKRSFEITSQEAGFAIPPIFWSMLPNAILEPVDRLLGRNLLFAISHQTLAIKK